jgi:thioredoxin-like negative regulator of GroEL
MTERPSLFSSEPFTQALQASRGSGELLIIDFTAEWCAPCQAMDKGAWRDERVASWVRDHGKAIQIDVDKDREIAARYHVQAMPTVVALRDGEEIDRFTGGRSADDVLTWFDGILRGETELDRLKHSAEAPIFTADFSTRCHWR